MDTPFEQLVFTPTQLIMSSSNWRRFRMFLKEHFEVKKMKNILIIQECMNFLNEIFNLL
jgi:hypothetical protein